MNPDAILRQTLQHAASFTKGVLDLVYPPLCVLCGRADGGYLCGDCVGNITLIDYPYCRTCGAPSETVLCRECRNRQFAFESARSAGIYEGVLREAIHALKYSFHAPAAEPLGMLMVERFPVTRLAGKTDVVVPVPIHSSRKVARGFNQSEELARILCAHTSMRLQTNALHQARGTRHQANLSYDERAANVKGAYAVRDPRLVRGKRILLIDDVITTGATSNEAASTLIEAGARSVHVYTLARSV